MAREYRASFAPRYPDSTEGDRVYALPADSVMGALDALAAAIDGYGEPPGGLPVALIDGEQVAPNGLAIDLTWAEEDAKATAPEHRYGACGVTGCTECKPEFVDGAPVEEDAKGTGFVPCDRCGAGECDPTLERRPGEGVICDGCRDGAGDAKGGES